MPTVAVLADTGGAEFHVGDEAMLAAAVRRLDADVEVVGRAHGDDELDAAVARADALLVAGGGNLSSSWPELVAQRVRALRAAAARGIPAALGGQTLGPALNGEQREAVASALAGAALVGVRERPSAALAAELGVPADRIVPQVDDAFLLHGEPPADPALRALAGAPVLAATLDGSFAVPAARVELLRLATQLAATAHELALPVVVQPHLGPLGEVGESDGEAGRVVAAVLAGEGVACTVTPVLAPAETVWITQRAALVASSRYHPLVFAGAGAVPALGVHTDEYTRIKLEGALEHVGAEAWVLPRGKAVAGGLAAGLKDLWAQREAVSTGMRERLPAIGRAEDARWARLAGALRL
jgi:polysaccharide pyruvyl transferase WcaK-like protein